MNLNKEATKKAIIKKCGRSKVFSINTSEFNKKFNSEKDIIEACEFCRVEPIYF